ncbi:hypothetical protein [Nonlabens sp. Asnod2-A12]|uniref:hypothetical protein n=1 Tax=Nonlabens sp. Asnod2-A12 TaxID=3160578 RepID=UPI00386314F5
MKKHFNKTVFILCIGLLFMSCDTEQKTTVAIDDTVESAEDFTIKKDSTAIKVLKLPVHIDSTQYLYHAIAIERVAIDDDFSISKSRYGSYGAASTSYKKYTFSGEYAGFIVEDIQTGNKINVINEGITITSATIYNKLENNPRVEFVLYKGHNLDTNKDKKLNHNDLSALFISDLDGSNFTKLTEDFEEFNGQRFIVENDKLYFQTQKDVNGNGIFDSSDNYRNYVVDLTAPVKKAVRYDEQLMNITKQ